MSVPVARVEILYNLQTGEINISHPTDIVLSLGMLSRATVLLGVKKGDEEESKPKSVIEIPRMVPPSGPIKS